MVGIQFTPCYAPAKRVRAFLNATLGCEGSLPDTYGMKAEELVEILNKCLAAQRDRKGDPSKPSAKHGSSGESLPSEWTGASDGELGK